MSRASPPGSPHDSDGSIDSAGSHDSTDSSLDSCGPSAPDEYREGEARLTGPMRVFTRAGCPTLESLAGKTAEVWTGRRWAEVRVREAASRPGEGFVRVSLDNGACLECSTEHPWALVVQPRIRPVRTGDAGVNHLCAPFLPMDARDLGGAADAKAYTHGYQFGRKITEKRGSRAAISEAVFQLNPPSLSMFVAGWFDAQNGSFFGPRPVIHGLKLLLCRIGVCSTIVGDIMGNVRTLSVSVEDGERIPNPTGRIRTSLREIRCGSLPRIASVAALEPKPARVFTLESDATCLVVVDGVLTIC